LLAGAAWSYGGQLATVVLQVAYASLTSRVVGPSAFGEYAVALSVGALASIFATGGLGQAVGRLHNPDAATMTALLSRAFSFGLAACVLVVLTAPVMAELWGAPQARDAILMMSLVTVLAPAFGLFTGLARRLGHFASLASVLLVSNLLGFVCGAVAVIAAPSSVTLLISPLTAMAVPAVVLGIRYRRHFWLRRLFRSVPGTRDATSFTWKVTISRILAYLNWNIGKWAVSRFVGPESFGHWNRADTLTGVPFNQAQSTINQTLYPEFRHDIKTSSRARETWPDLLGLAAWLYWPLAALVAAFGPSVLLALFGNKWELAAEMTVPLAILAAVQGVLTLLGSALEALGKFAPVWGTQLMFLVIQVGGAVVTLHLRSWIPAVLGLLVAAILQHAMHLLVLRRRGYISVRRVLIKYLGAGAFSVSLGWVCSLLLWLPTTNVPSWVPICAGAVTLIGSTTLLWTFRDRLPPVRIVKKYRIL